MVYISSCGTNFDNSEIASPVQHGSLTLLQMNHESRERPPQDYQIFWLSYSVGVLVATRFSCRPRVVQGPQQLQTFWSHILNIAIVSSTSKRPQTDIHDY